MNKKLQALKYTTQTCPMDEFWLPQLFKRVCWTGKKINLQDFKFFFQLSNLRPRKKYHRPEVFLSTGRSRLPNATLYVVRQKKDLILIKIGLEGF